MIDIFTVYGPGHVGNIRDLLIPALQGQEGASPLRLNLLSYASTRRMFPAEEVHGAVRVRDLSDRRPDGHLGFGEGQNWLFRLVKPKGAFICLNPDTIPQQGFVAALLRPFSDPGVGVVEGRQLPSEHPKEYDPVTGDTPWASGACVAFAADVFARLEGFDPLYFMYTEDVDISWRTWLLGRRVVYARDAMCMHYTGLHYYHDDRFYLEHFYGARNFLVIAYKFFGPQGEARAQALLADSGYPKGFRELVLGEYARLKPGIRRVAGAEAQPQIRIRGFNEFHEPAQRGRPS